MMCGRYWIEESEEIRRITEEMDSSPLVLKWQSMGTVKRLGEIRPTDIVPVIAPNRRAERAVFPMKWGYAGKSLLVNARTETAAQKPTFRADWQGHRCIVPASWYFEWEHFRGSNGKPRTGSKYIIRPKGASMTWLCGLYRIENGMPYFVILTREPGEGIRFIHDRMPLIMPGEYVSEWIRPDVKAEDLLPYALTDMDFGPADRKREESLLL